MGGVERQCSPNHLRVMELSPANSLISGGLIREVTLRRIPMQRHRGGRLLVASRWTMPIPPKLHDCSALECSKSIRERANCGKAG